MSVTISESPHCVCCAEPADRRCSRCTDPLCSTCAIPSVNGQVVCGARECRCEED